MAEQLTLAKTDNELKLSLDISNGDVDLLNAHLHASIDGHQRGDFCGEVDLSLQVIDIQPERNTI